VRDLILQFVGSKVPKIGQVGRRHTSWCVMRCPRRESNPHLRFRKPSFFPLNYGDQQLEKEFTDKANMSKLLVLIRYISRSAGFALDSACKMKFINWLVLR
jgi:hypothetical protein